MHSISENSENTQVSRNEVPLGITHGISVRSKKLDDNLGIVNRFRLQSAARDILPLERIRICCKVPVPQKDRIEMWRMRGDGQQPAYYSGLMRCHNAWQCPVCSSSISEHRREELKIAISKTNYTPVLITFTMSHSATEGLKNLVDTMSKAWKTLTGQRAYKGIKHDYGYVGAVRTLEVTWGKANGWHPHFHMLMLLNDRYQVYENDIKARLHDVWQRSLQVHGRDCNFEHGVDVTFDKANIAEYVAKGGQLPDDEWGITEELTKAHSKTKKAKDGRFTPFKLLDAYLAGKEWAKSLFREYAYAVKGRSQLHWSRGLQKLLNIPKIRDEQIAQREIDHELFEIVANIGLPEWRQIAANKEQGALLLAISHRDYDAFEAIVGKYSQKIGVGKGKQDGKIQVTQHRRVTTVSRNRNGLVKHHGDDTTDGRNEVGLREGGQRYSGGP